MTQTLLETPKNLVENETPRTISLGRRVLPMATTVGVSFGIVALQLAQGILLARLLGPQGRGEYAAAVLFPQLLLYAGLFGAVEVVCRYAANNRFNRKSLRRSAGRLSLMTGIATTLLVIMCIFLGMPLDKRYLLPLAMLCSLSIIGQHATLVLTAVDRGSGDFARYNRNRLIAATAFPILLALWAVFAQTTLLSTCVLLVIATLLSTVPCFIGIKDRPGDEEAPPALQLGKEGSPYGLSMLATDLFERLDLLLMLWLTSLVTQGFYNAMVPVAYPLTVIPNTLGMYLFNTGAREGGGLTVSRVRHILVFSFLLQIATTIGFLILVGPVVRFVYGVEFAPAVVFAMWLAPVAAIKGIVQGLESYIKGRGRPMATIGLRVFSAVAMLASIALLYPITNVLSIVQGSLVGQVVCVIGLSLIVYKDAKEVDRPTTTNANNNSQYHSTGESV